MDRIVLLRLIMSHNSICLPVVANGFLIPIYKMELHEKKEAAVKKSGNLSIVSIVSKREL